MLFWRTKLYFSLNRLCFSLSYGAIYCWFFWYIRVTKPLFHWLMCENCLTSFQYYYTPKTDSFIICTGIDPCSLALLNLLGKPTKKWDWPFVFLCYQPYMKQIVVFCKILAVNAFFSLGYFFFANLSFWNVPEVNLSQSYMTMKRLIPKLREHRG